MIYWNSQKLTVDNKLEESIMFPTKIATLSKMFIPLQSLPLVVYLIFAFFSAAFSMFCECQILQDVLSYYIS